MKINLMLPLILLVFVKAAFATEECKPLNKDLNSKNTLHYKMLVQNSLKQKVKLETIDINQVLTEENWLAISASTDISEPGVLFFKDNTFVDVWGGRVDPEDKGDVIKWARNIHAPEKLTECFYQSILIK